jgi:hypothetical protein
MLSTDRQREMMKMPGISLEGVIAGNFNFPRFLIKSVSFRMGAGQRFLDQQRVQ